MKRSLSFDEIYLNSTRGKVFIKKREAKARAVGMTRGLARGISKGEAGKAKAIAKNMKSGGMSDKLISKYTGLSLAKVKKI